MRLECINTAFQVDMEPLSISQVHLRFLLRGAGIDEPTGLPKRAWFALAWVMPWNRRMLEQHCLAHSPLSLNSWPPRFQIPKASPGKVCKYVC